MFSVLRLLTDDALADSIAGDLAEERRRRATRSRAGALLWFWHASIAVMISTALARLRDALYRDSLRSGVMGFGGGRHDGRHALRSLRRTPWYSLTAISVIALSMALASTVFAVVDGVLFKPLPYADADTLYEVSGGFIVRPDVAMPSVSPADVAAWAAAAPDLRFTAGSIGGAITVADNDYLRVAQIDRHFFDVVGVRPLLGGFGEQDFAPTSKIRPAIVSYDVWRRRLGGASDVIGRLLVDQDGTGARVVGVMPADFVYPHPAGRVAPEALTPLPDPSPAALRDPTRRSLQILARVPRDVTLTSVEGRLAAGAREVAQRFPVLPDNPSISPTRRITRGPFDAVRLRPLRGVMVAATRGFALASFGVAATLLLLGALNLAGLAGGRALDRRRELTLRVALGGSTWNLVRLLATEHAIVVGAGALLGMGLSPWLLQATLALLPNGIMLIGTPAISARVLAFGLSTAVVSTALVTIWSTRASLKAGLRPVLSEASGATPRVRSIGRSWLIGAQVSLALVMALGGALLSASLVRVWREDPGFQVDRTARIRVNSPSAFSLEAMNALLDAIGRVPGVRAVGGLDEPFLERMINGSGFDKPSGSLPTGDVEQMSVTSGFFPAVGLVSRDGRLPTREEFDLGRRVVVVSRSVEAAFWPGRRAVGQTLTEDGQTFEVIGVVPDIRHTSLDRASDGEIYSSNALQKRPDLLNLVVGFDGPPSDSLQRVLVELSARTPAMKIVRAEMMSDALGASVQMRRFQTWLFVAFGGAALAIVGVGILGAIAMAVARRTKEVGIRMALGARWTNVTSMVLREQFRPVVAGVVCGSLGSLWFVRFLSDYLYQMTAYDWFAWVAAIAALLCVAFGAALVPALGASRVDPVRALRAE